MEHIHGGILCLLCKWISPPWSQAKGQKESPLSFIIAVYWNTLKHLRHRRRKKKGWIYFCKKNKKTKKVNSRQMLASKRSQVFGAFFWLFFGVLHRAGSSLFMGVLCCGLLMEKTGQASKKSCCHCHCECRITALEQVVIRVAEV